MEKLSDRLHTTRLPGLITSNLAGSKTYLGFKTMHKSHTPGFLYSQHISHLGWHHHRNPIQNLSALLEQVFLQLHNGYSLGQSNEQWQAASSPRLSPAGWSPSVVSLSSIIQTSDSNLFVKNNQNVTCTVTLHHSFYN